MLGIPKGMPWIGSLTKSKMGSILYMCNEISTKTCMCVRGACGMKFESVEACANKYRLHSKIQQTKIAIMKI